MHLPFVLKTSIVLFEAMHVSYDSPIPGRLQFHLYGLIFYSTVNLHLFIHAWFDMVHSFRNDTHFSCRRPIRPKVLVFVPLRVLLRRYPWYSSIPDLWKHCLGFEPPLLLLACHNWLLFTLHHHLSKFLCCLNWFLLDAVGLVVLCWFCV